MLKILTSITVLLLSSNAFAQLEKIEKGKGLYLAYGCAVCHGKEGRGDGVSAKGMDPAPTDFHKVKNYHHGASKGDIIYSIKHGQKESQTGIMPPFTYLTDKELEQLSSFLVSLQEDQK